MSECKASVPSSAEQIGDLFVQRDGLVVVVDGRVVIPFSEVDFAPVVEGLDKLGVQFDGFAEGLDGIGEVSGDSQ